MAGRNKFFSAELVEATTKHERRVRVINRETGDYYYRPFPNRDTGVSLEQQLRYRIYEIHTSALFDPRVLWHDKKLGITFFELVYGKDNG